MSLLWRRAMAWRDLSGKAPATQAISVRAAGFKGYVAPYDPADEEAEYGHGHGHEFDEDLHDKTRPEPTEAESKHEHEHGDLPDSYHERHDEAYSAALHKKEAESEPDHVHHELGEFVSEHGSDADLWHKHATYGPVDLSKGVYATQSHVHPIHLARHKDGYGPPDRPGHGYLGDDAPMFVTHEGRLHCTEGHHRVAATLARGEKHAVGWHWNADEHGLPGYTG